MVVRDSTLERTFIVSSKAIVRPSLKASLCSDSISCGDGGERVIVKMSSSERRSGSPPGRGITPAPCLISRSSSMADCGAAALTILAKHCEERGERSDMKSRDACMFQASAAYHHKNEPDIVRLTPDVRFDHVTNIESV